jgi:glutamate synthase (NADPH/NADH) small chain
MPEQEPEIRARNFLEVPTGYTEEMAMKEAQRCLQCKKPGCVAGCPVEIDIPGFIQLIQDGDFTKSIRHIWQKNSLPAVCGRVCPQEIQCEGLCILAKKGDSVAIGNLESSGPAGLTVAGDLIVKGHDVTVFEAFHKSGGVLVYGIPEFRLPKEIVVWARKSIFLKGSALRLNAIRWLAEPLRWMSYLRTGTTPFSSVWERVCQPF